jgi:hypothetical protein
MWTIGCCIVAVALPYRCSGYIFRFRQDLSEIDCRSKNAAILWIVAWAKPLLFAKRICASFHRYPALGVAKVLRPMQPRTVRAVHGGVDQLATTALVNIEHCCACICGSFIFLCPLVRRLYGTWWNGVHIKSPNVKSHDGAKTYRIGAIERVQFATIFTAPA